MEGVASMRFVDISLALVLYMSSIFSDNYTDSTIKFHIAFPDRLMSHTKRNVKHCH
jgi:hypothetical protein